MTDALSITRDLVRCPSITPADAGALGVLEKPSRPPGLKSTASPSAKPAPPTSTISSPHRHHGPHINFAGHTDVVPPGDESRLDRRRVFRRGEGRLSLRPRRRRHEGRHRLQRRRRAANISPTMAASRRTAGSISFLITGDEEDVAINGTIKLLQWAAARGEKFDHCVLGEPSNVETLGDCIKIGRRGSSIGHALRRRHAGPRRLSAPRRQPRAGYCAPDRGAQRRAARSGQRAVPGIEPRIHLGRRRQQGQQRDPRRRRGRSSTSASTITTPRSRCASWSRRAWRRPPATGSGAHRLGAINVEGVRDQARRLSPIWRSPRSKTSPAASRNSQHHRRHLGCALHRAAIVR